MDSFHSLVNEHTLKGKWKEIKGSVKETWGKLTDDDLTTIDGNIDQLTGKIEQAYGYSKEKAIEEFNKFKEKHFGNQPDQNAKLTASRADNEFASKESNKEYSDEDSDFDDDRASNPKI